MCHSREIVPIDSAEALRRATLVRSDPSLSGVSRENISSEEGGFEWQYRTPDGVKVEDSILIQRWNSLGLPPAWSEVWICPNARGHIQATGFDPKGRLQYSYHPEWTDITTEMKYDDVVYFASQLPRLRKQVERDLEQSTMELHTVAALVVRLIDLYNIRVGSDEYAKANNSYGLTTLKSMHVKHIQGDDAEGRHDAVFTFTGKSDKNWEITIEDDHLVDLILRTNRLGVKNADLFMYISEAGNEVDLKAEHINQYIRASSGEGFTAKNFRTWAATHRCAERLAFLAQPQTANALIAIFSMARAGQLQHRSLRGAVMAPAFQHPIGRTGRNIEDRPTPLCRHDRQGRLHHVKDTFNIHINHPVPIGGFEIRHSMHRQEHSCVVDDNIKTTEARHSLINSRLHLCKIGNIAGDRQRF